MIVLYCVQLSSIPSIVKIRSLKLDLGIEKVMPLFLGE